MTCNIIQGDCREVLKTIPDESVQCCVTSPPYWGLRDYGCACQIGLEKSPQEYVETMVQVFREVRRILKDDGVLFLNLGDSYAGSCMTGGNNGYNASGGENGYGIARQFRKQTTPFKAGKENTQRAGNCPELRPKNLIGIPWRVAFALQSDGWYLRQDIIWKKPNPMPESVTDRCTKAHEYIFLMTKSARYYFDAMAISEPAIYGDRGSSFESEYDRETKAGLGAKRRQTVARGGFNGKTNALPGRESFRSIKDWRNKRSVWTVPSAPYSGAHFATFPPDLIKPCVLAGTKPGDTILDPFGGSGTVGQVATEFGRNSILIELNSDYVELAKDRTNVTKGLAL